MTITPDRMVAGRNRLEYVDQLRALAALYVAVFHVMLTVWPAGGPRPPWYFRWADYGHFGVTAFIVVSGFSLALRPATRGMSSVGNYWQFMKKRALRILPPYWLALLGSIVLLMVAPGNVTRGNAGGVGGEWTGKSAVPLRSVAAFFTLTHDLVRVPSPNSPMWSIAVEWHLYFLFPVMLYAAHRFGLARLLLGSIVVGVALHYLVVHTSAAGTTPHFVALFCFGIVAAYAVAAARRPRAAPSSGHSPPGWLVIAASFAAFAVLSDAEVLADLVAGALFAYALVPPRARRACRGPTGHVAADAYRIDLLQPLSRALPGREGGVAFRGTAPAHVELGEVPPAHRHRCARRRGCRVGAVSARRAPFDGVVATGGELMRDACPASRRGRALWMPLCAVLGLAVLYVVAVRTGWGQRLDEKAVFNHRYDRTRDSDAHLVGMLLGVASLTFAPVLLRRVRRDSLARAACLATVAATVTAEVLRRGVFARPVLIGSDSLNGPSFPSGHTAAAMSIALGVGLVVPAARRLRLASLATAVVIGAVAVFVPTHRVSDVVGGYLLATFFMGIVAIGAPRSESRIRLVAIAYRMYARVAVALLVVLLASAQLGARRAGLSLADFGRAFAVAIVVVITVATALVMLFERVYLVRRPRPHVGTAFAHPLRLGSEHG